MSDITIDASEVINNLRNMDQRTKAGITTIGNTVASQMNMLNLIINGLIELAVQQLELPQMLNGKEQHLIYLLLMVLTMVYGLRLEEILKVNIKY